MKNFLIKLFFITTISVIYAMANNLSEYRFFITFGFISFIALTITILAKSIKKPKSNFSFLKSLAFLTALFTPFYLFFFNWISLPSLIILFYADIVGNHKEFLYKIYKRESMRIKRVQRQEERRKENIKFHNQLKNLYHEKDGRRLYIADM